MTQPVDYANKGITIADAMLDLAIRYPKKSTRPTYILWNGLSVTTADCFSVPVKGRVKIDILSKQSNVTQGIDIKVGNGAIRLMGGEEISLLRTWADDRYEDQVEYHFYSKSGILSIWNVYIIRFPNGKTRVEKWTGNAGFWIEYIDKCQRIYHCSNGCDESPNFNSLVFKITIVPLNDK